MKKAAVTILLLVYFAASTGATIHVHYCMGELKSWKLWRAEEKKKGCATCGMKKKSGCCEDKQIVIKVDKKHNIPLSSFSLYSLPVSHPSYQALAVPIAYSKMVTRLLSDTSPPGTSCLPLFIKNCVYRI